MTIVDIDAEIPLKGCSYPASYSTEAMREMRLAAYRAGLEAAAKEYVIWKHDGRPYEYDEVLRALKERIK